MGHYKERTAVVIQATLKDWRLDDEHACIAGTVFNSINPKEYPEGVRYTIMKVKIYEYPESLEFGEAHLIAETALGNSFRLNLSDQR